ncbi:hypothetical protein [Burkholderia sp. Tr-20390]|uniref:hypothetical protein n=1 Tax=Burkholderia sp. Tr-20390 TaxID=2703904 RepID=UPI001980D315|nr:hypothetical protein [Burkholderia sp. Tr-20390]MBN3729483.1 hypothetical protein [Burkholderia sp. Tr-20390]
MANNPQPARGEYDLAEYFRMKRPCKNCPFLKEGGIELAPGRMEDIVNHLYASDENSFQCHETVHSDKFGGKWDDETGDYNPSGKEAHCAGAAAFLQKTGMSSKWMRIGYVTGALDFDQVRATMPAVIDSANEHHSSSDPHD